MCQCLGKLHDGFGQGETAEGEENVEVYVAMLDVADFVAEDGLDFLSWQGVEQCVGNEDVAERADRPYRILATGDSVASLIPVKSLKSAEENRSKGTEPGRFGARGAGGARSRRGGGFGGLPDAGFAGSATVNRGRRARYLVPDAAEQSDEEVEEVIELSLESLFPERPGIDEDDSGDWQFELEWEVELIPPNEARKKADADKAGKTADAGEPGAADTSRADTALTRTIAENRS